MNWTPRILATLAIATGVVVLALWFAFSGKPALKSVPSDPATEPGPQASRTNKPGFFSPRPRPAAGNSNPTLATTNTTGTNQIADWETVLEDLLRDETTEPNAKAKQLLDRFPRVPAESQAEAAQHIANLIADEDYALLAGYFTSTNSPVEVQEVILADLLGRPNAIKLPVLLDAARTPQHAKASDAKDVLEIYLEHDYGTDWDLWQKNLEEWLKTHAD